MASFDLTSWYSLVVRFVFAGVAASSVGAAEAGVGISSLMGATEATLPSSTLGESAAPLLFTETIGGVIGSGGLATDHDGSSVVAKPTVTNGVVNAALSPSTISAGTKYNSYLFSFNPNSTADLTYITTIEFEQPIIGVQLFGSGSALERPETYAYVGTLEAGDAAAVANGAPASLYPTGLAGRGVEDDEFVLAISCNRVMLAGSVIGGDIDQVRFLTAAISTPEPASMAVWCLLASSVIMRRRR